MNRLTEPEYKDIKSTTDAYSFDLKTIAKMKKRSYTVVRQVNNSRDFLDYKMKYYKNYKPSLTERIMSWLR
jgi:hypothetical protein